MTDLTLEQKEKENALKTLIEIYPNNSKEELTEIIENSCVTIEGILEEDEILTKCCDFIERNNEVPNRLTALQKKIDNLYDSSNRDFVEKKGISNAKILSVQVFSSPSSDLEIIRRKPEKRKLMKFGSVAKQKVNVITKKKRRIQESDSEDESEEILRSEDETSESSFASDESDDDSTLNKKQSELLEVVNSEVNPLLLTELFNNNQVAQTLIKRQKPFSSFSEFLSFLNSQNIKSEKILNYYYEYYDHVNELDSVLSDCSNLSQSLLIEFKEILSKMPSIEGDEYLGLNKQPPFLDTSLNLKEYQLIGVNWLLLLHTKSIGGILADEMGLGKTCQVITFCGMVKLLNLGKDGKSMKEWCDKLLKEKNEIVAENTINLVSEPDIVEVSDDDEEYEVPDKEEVITDNKTEKERFLVVVPASVVQNWKREFEKWCPILNVQIYSGTQPERIQLQAILSTPSENSFDIGNFDVLLTSYNTLSALDRSFLRRCRFSYMVLDEGHLLKNSSSQRYRNLEGLKIKNRILLTGTPLQNNLKELITLLMFCVPSVFKGKEESLMKIFSGYSSKSRDVDIGLDYTESKSSSTSENLNSTKINPLRLTRIEKAGIIMKPFVLRRKKINVLKEMPKKIEHVIYCDPTDYQMKIYKQIVSSTNLTKDDKTDNKPAKKQEVYNNILMQLRKVACHPLLVRNLYDSNMMRSMAKLLIRKEETYWDANEQYIFEDMEVMNDAELSVLCTHFPSLSSFKIGNYKFKEDKEWWLESGKVKYLMETLLPTCYNSGDKVLLFSQFTMMLDIWESILKHSEYKYLRMDGQTDVQLRQELIDEYQNGEVFIFLLSTKAGGFGINLTEANVVILYDLDFNPHNDAQAEDRAHRVGQKRDVNVYKLICKKSIEEQVYRMGLNKLMLDKSLGSSDALNAKELLSLVFKESS